MALLGNKRAARPEYTRHVEDLCPDKCLLKQLCNNYVQTSSCFWTHKPSVKNVSCFVSALTLDKQVNAVVKSSFFQQRLITK